MNRSEVNSKTLVYPECINKKEANMVCLSEKCGQHPFFCTICDNPSCQAIHTHEDKPTSISFKLFSYRVLRIRKPIEELSKAMESYRVVLEKLKEDVNQFIEKQLKQMQDIEKKIAYIPEQDQGLIERLRNMEYQGFNGKIMDHLWSQSMDTQQKKEGQEETADFIKIKEDQVKAISQHFQSLNHMDYNSTSSNQHPNNENIPKKKIDTPNKNPH